jgi:hypothetical protein
MSDIQNKQKRWKQVWEKYDEMEEGVREAVVALNLLGVNTIASCEGHMDHGVAASWIDTSLEMNEEIAEKVKKADELQDAAEHLLIHRRDNPDVRRLFTDYEELRDEILFANLQETLAVEKLLTKFYKKRDCEYRVRIILNIYGRGTGRLISQGGLYQEAFSEEIQAKNLELFQKEMVEFGIWLKEKWMKE